MNAYKVKYKRGPTKVVVIVAAPNEELALIYASNAELHPVEFTSCEALIAREVYTLYESTPIEG